MRNVFQSIKSKLRYFRVRKYEGCNYEDLIGLSFIWTAVSAFAFVYSFIFDGIRETCFSLGMVSVVWAFCFSLLPCRFRFLMTLAIPLFFYLYLNLLFFVCYYAFLFWEVKYVP